jgi:hypothetical protein
MVCEANEVVLMQPLQDSLNIIGRCTGYETCIICSFLNFRGLKDPLTLEGLLTEEEIAAR